MEILYQLVKIFWSIVLPMFLLAGAGFALQKILGLDVQTLTRFNFYVVLPCFVYLAVVSSELTGSQIFTVVGFSVTMVILLILCSYILCVLFGVRKGRRQAVMLGAFLYNSGNYGLPVQDLAFRPLALAPEALLIQSFVIIVQNFSSFTLGVFLAAHGGRGKDFRGSLLQLLKFPPLYALAAGLITVQIEKALSPEASESIAQLLKPFRVIMEHGANSVVSVGLVILGAQLAAVGRRGEEDPLLLSVPMRLVGGPVLGLLLILLFGLDGFVAQVLLISTSMPTAINAMLLAVEFKNHPQYLSRQVFYTTILSPLTITGVIFFARNILFPE